MTRRKPGLIVVSYLTIYMVWGSTYFFIKRSVETIPPFWVMGIRWTIGGTFLLLLSLIRGRLKVLPTPREVLASIALGSLLILIGNGGITVAERGVDSYIAALLASSSPIVVAFFDRLLLRKVLTLARILGVVIGFAGIALLMYNGRSMRTSLDFFMIVGVIAAVSWGFATSLGHRFPVSGDNTVNSGIQMLFVGMISLAGSIAFDAPPAVLASGVSARSAISVLYLAVLGSVAYSAYTYLMSTEPAARVVSYALVNPIIALLLGLGLGRESPTPLLFIGAPLAILGLGFMLYGEKIVAWMETRPRKGTRGVPRQSGDTGRDDGGLRRG